MPASPLAESPRVVASAQLPPAWLRAFDVHAGTVQSLRVPESPGNLVGIDVVLAGRPVTLELLPFEVRSASFQLWTRTAAGLVPQQAPPSTTWRGSLVGDPGSAVAATLDGGLLTAYVRKGDGELWIVQPLRDGVPGAPAASHVVFRGADGAPVNGHCGVTAAPVPVAPGQGGVDVQYVCDLALEADFPLFQLDGSSVAATQNDVLGIVNAVDLIYQNDVQIHFVVSQLVVDAAPDPYTTSYASGLLAEFQNQWNGAYGAIARDVAHLFSGRAIGAASSGTIGIGYVGVVCNLPASYALSQTHWSSNYAYRVGVTAHEIGHNFNATHCDGQPGCSLMCSMIGGCAGNPGAFSAAEQAQIIAYRQGATCLVMQPTAPWITSATPPQFATVNPPLVTLAGTGFLGTTLVTVGSQQVTNGIQVVSDTQMRFPPPIGMPLGAHPVSVTNPAGTSNAALLTYTAANPCQVLVPNAIFGGATFVWSMGGWPYDDGFLVVSFLGTTSPFLGQQVLDTFLLIWGGALDARGMATLSVTVPQGLLTGYTIHSQLLDVDPATSTLRSVSSTPGTWFVF